MPGVVGVSGVVGRRPVSRPTGRPGTPTVDEDCRSPAAPMVCRARLTAIEEPASCPGPHPRLRPGGRLRRQATSAACPARLPRGDRRAAAKTARTNLARPQTTPVQHNATPRGSRISADLHTKSGAGSPRSRCPSLRRVAATHLSGIHHAESAWHTEAGADQETKLSTAAKSGDPRRHSTPNEPARTGNRSSARPQKDTRAHPHPAARHQRPGNSSRPCSLTDDRGRTNGPRAFMPRRSSCGAGSVPDHGSNPVNHAQAEASSAAPKETSKRSHQILTLLYRDRSTSSGTA